MAFRGRGVTVVARITRPAGALVAAVAALTVVAWPSLAEAQSAVCQQIMAQIARLDASGASRGPANPRFAALANRQRAEIASATQQYQSAGCGGFFQPGQCSGLQARIGQMRANLAQLEAQARGSGGQSVERIRLMQTLAANNCRRGPPPPDTRQAAPQPQQPRGLFGSLFGGDTTPEREIYRTARTPDGGPQTAYRVDPQQQQRQPNFIEQLFGGGQPREPVREVDPSEQAGLPALGEEGERPRGVGYRAVCVRLCDGAFFPMTSAARPGANLGDQDMCQMQCPGTEVALFRMRDDRIENAVSSTGRSYSSLPNALRFRQRFDATCTCRPRDGSWASAFSGRQDPTLRSGDQVVSADQARLLSLPASQRQEVREQIAAEERARRDAERQARADRLRESDRPGAQVIGLDGRPRQAPAPEPAEVEMRQTTEPPAAETATTAPSVTPADPRAVRHVGPIIAPRAGETSPTPGG